MPEINNFYKPLILIGLFSIYKHFVQIIINHITTHLSIAANSTINSPTLSHLKQSLNRSDISLVIEIHINIQDYSCQNI